MMELARAALEQFGTAGAVAGVVFLRVGAAMAVMPGLGERMIPMRIRLALALVLTAVIAPAASAQIAPVLPAGASVTLLAAETIAGLAMGLVLRLTVFALEIAGSIAAQATSLSQLLGTPSVDPQPAMGHVMVLGGLTLAVIAGLHVKLVAFLLLSYDVLPPGVFPDPAALADLGTGHVARVFGLALSLAAPFVIASLVYNLALGVINRAMPQLMVAFVGAPAITAGGLILMALSLPVLLGVWHAAFERVLSAPLEGLP